MSDSIVAGVDASAGTHAFTYNGSNQLILDTWTVAKRIFVKAFSWSGALKVSESDWVEIVVTGSSTPSGSLTAKFQRGSGAVQWTRTPAAGGAPADIADATALTYAVKRADRGYVIGPRVTSFVPEVLGSDVPFEVPTAPVMGTVTAGTARVTAEYSAPSDDGGKVVSSYDAQLIKDGVPTASLAGVPNPVVFGSVQGVRPGERYGVRVRANNSIGPGPYSPVSSLVTAGGGVVAPSVPGAPVIGALTASSAAVTGAFSPPASDGGAAVTNYVMSVYRSSDNVMIGQANAATSPGTLTGIANGVAVYCKFAAQNSVGTGPQSAASNTVTPADAPVALSTDLLVYGSSLGAVLGAIRAKNEGVNVMLISPGRTLGGMAASGIQFTDAHSGSPLLRATIPEATLTNKVYASLSATFGLSQQAHFRDYSYAVESKAMVAELSARLAAAGITPVFNKPVLSMTKTGATGTSVTFYDGTVVNAKVFIECSYTGDLLYTSNADYYVGGEAASTYGETAQQAGFVVAGSQPANFVDPYIVPGDASSGLIKWVDGTPLQAAGSAVPGKVQFGGFRLSITDVAGKKIAFTQPAEYNPADFELHRRDNLANKQSATTISNFLNLQSGNQAKPVPPIPSTTAGMTNKRDVNNNGQFSLDFPDVAQNAKMVAKGTTPAEKEAIVAAARSYYRCYFWFLLTDTSVPAAARADIARYGWCNDDYLDNNGEPPEMYVREGPRAVGDSVVNANANAGTNLIDVPDPIGLDYYARDKHSRQILISLNGGPHVIQEGGTPQAVAHTLLGSRWPARLLFPKKSQWDNGLVVTTPNCSQMYFNSFRMEPSMAIAAEAAALLAAVAIKTNTKVQDVPYSSYGPLLNLYGLDTPNALTITSDQITRTQGTMTFQGTWTENSTIILGTKSIQSTSATTGINSFTATPDITVAGNYLVQVKYLDTGATRGKLNMVVTSGGVAQAGMLINQNSETVGVNTNGDWQIIGTYAFTANDGANNKLVGTSSNEAGLTANIAAVRFVKV